MILRNTGKCTGTSRIQITNIKISINNGKMKKRILYWESLLTRKQLNQEFLVVAKLKSSMPWPG